MTKPGGSIMTDRARSALFLLVSFLSACDPTQLGVTRSRAIEIAQQQVANQPTVLVASAGKLGTFVTANILPGADRSTHVWAIVLNDGMPGECVATPSGHICPPTVTTTEVILEFKTGVVLVSLSPAWLDAPGFDQP